MSFNEWHVLAIAQAICQYRKNRGIDGPLFLGIDTHALSQPACASALEVLAETLAAEDNPAVTRPLADRIVKEAERLARLCP